MRLLLAVLMVSHLIRPPGAVNPAVTQKTIHTTICQTGWATSVRPPYTFSGPLKHAWTAAEGVKASQYQLDHLVPLELGGAPRNTRNLWLEPIADAHVKDRRENLLHAQVCAGTTTLAKARAQMRHWAA